MLSTVLSSLFRLLLVLRDRVSSLIYQTLLLHHPQTLVDWVEFWCGSTITVKVRVGPGKVLAVIAGEVEVVQGVVSGGVDESFKEVARDHVSVVDKDSPELNENKETEVEVSVEREDVNENAADQREFAKRFCA